MLDEVAERRAVLDGLEAQSAELWGLIREARQGLSAAQMRVDKAMSAIRQRMGGGRWGR